MKIESLLAGVQSQAWAVLLRDWDRSLRAGNHPETTRYNYVLAASQLAAYLGERMPEVGGACDPSLVDSRQVTAFQAAVIEERSVGTGLNKYKALQQFFRWLVIEGEVERSPMDRVPQPTAVQKLVEVLSDEETRRILEVCEGRGFVQLRDQALVRMFYNTGGRLAEIGNLLVSDVDLDTDSVVLTGKGGKQRRVRFGAKTAGALRRYARARSRRPGLTGIDQLWIAAKGARPLKPNGIKIRLRELGDRAGVEHVHAQRWRHSFAHEWKLAGGDTGDLMLLMGWSSEEMPRRYGASAAAERAQQVHARLGIGERV
ncbi:tyrosine-type recombinase/integrase [Actinoplanes sp. NPDC051411]|uniref:tyrosine-type recombinase/integrase n=1 Tax=Actinoplanes sp. NPDC051411 TaxID=3155522 RepID=UPI00341A609A